MVAANWLLYLARILKRFDFRSIRYFPGDKKLMPAYDYETMMALAEGRRCTTFIKLAPGKRNLNYAGKMKVEKGKAVGTGELETIHQTY
jgi:hypothetical protein